MLNIDHLFTEFSVLLDDLILLTLVSQSENWFGSIICSLLVFQELYG